MKRIVGIDEKLLAMSEDESAERMLTRREMFRLIGNQKAETADDSRRVRRIITKLRDKAATDLVLENDDINFLEKLFEKNAMALPAWIQGQMLDLIESADKVEAEYVKA